MGRLVIGFLAHVDSGKTTLSEAVLYRSNAIRKFGRVDHGDAFLDNDPLERNRGITVFSKEARFVVGETEYTLIDTPGHSDFTGEMERTLGVLDYAVLIISAPDMIQEQTKVIWQLLNMYHVPSFIFVNKMDRQGMNRETIMSELKSYFGDGTFEMLEDGITPADYEEIAVASDELTEKFFADGIIERGDIKSGILECKLHPVFFGSALKLTGVDELLAGMDAYKTDKTYGLNFAAKVYKINRDKSGSRLTHMKIEGGSLKVKQLLDGEKVDQIRLYNGDSFSLVKEALPGDVVAITGPEKTRAGHDFTAGKKQLRALHPAEGIDVVKAFKTIEVLNEEDPTLEIDYDELCEEIRIRTMGYGSLEEEILRERILDRFGLMISFDEISGYVPERVLILGEDGYYYDEDGNAFDENGEPVMIETEEERQASFELWRMGSEETRREEKNLDRIFKRTYGESKRDKALMQQAQARATMLKRKEDQFPQPNWKNSKGNTHLIVDGYNVVFGWDEIKEMAAVNFDAARELLIEVLQNYQGYKKTGITLVFDGYKLAGNIGTEYTAGDIRVVYTKEGQTADRYIEEMVYEMGKTHDLTCVTSDLPVQMAAMGDGAKRLSVREFHDEVIATSNEIREKLAKQKTCRNRPFEGKF